MFSPEGKKILLFDNIVWLEISIYENLKNLLNWRSTNLRADTLNLIYSYIHTTCDTWAGWTAG